MRSANAQRYEWQHGSERPDMWSDTNWATFDRLVTAGGSEWVKAAYNAELFWLTPSVLDWIGVALDREAAVDLNGGDKVLMLLFDGWHVAVPLVDPRGNDPMWLRTSVGPLPESREMDRMLADFSAAAPTRRLVQRREGQLSVELTVPLTADFGADLTSLDQGRQALAAQAAEAGRQAYGDLLDEFVRVTLAAPPVPPALQSLLRRHDEWIWSTREADQVHPFQEYMLDDWTSEPSEDFVTVSYCGHGINSYGLTLSMAYGPIALMVQGGWGGVYDGAAANGRMAELYAHVATLVRMISERQPPIYTAPRRRPLRIVYSNFRDDLEAQRWDNVRHCYLPIELPEGDPWEPLIALTAGITMPG